MYLGILSAKVIDQNFEKAQPAEKRRGTIPARKAKKEVPETSHLEVRKIFVEANADDVAKNKDVENLDYYEIIAEPGKASLKKVAK